MSKSEGAVVPRNHCNAISSRIAPIAIFYILAHAFFISLCLQIMIQLKANLSPQRISVILKGIIPKKVLWSVIFM